MWPLWNWLSEIAVMVNRPTPFLKHAGGQPTHEEELGSVSWIARDRHVAISGGQRLPERLTSASIENDGVFSCVPARSAVSLASPPVGAAASPKRTIKVPGRLSARKRSEAGWT